MKNRTVKIITISFSVVAVALLLVYMYVYKDARDIAAEEAAYSLSAEQLIADYEADMQAADAKYLNKTIAVAGTVTQVADSILTIDAAVFCTFSNKQTVAVDETVTIKGRCIGYDEIFGEVKLDQCTTKD